MKKKPLRGILTERFKSEHEQHIRQIASGARTSYYRDKYNYKTAKGPLSKYDPVDLRRKSNHPNHFSRYGECGTLAFAAMHELKKHYPSAHVCSSWYKHPKKGMVDHCWVEIPEIKHYVDPSHDQMHNFEKHRKVAPTRNGNYPDSAVKVGHTDSAFYKQRYEGPKRDGEGNLVPAKPFDPRRDKPPNTNKKSLLTRLKGLFT
jgi:hypothetical protein